MGKKQGCNYPCEDYANCVNVRKDIRLQCKARTYIIYGQKSKFLYSLPIDAKWSFVERLWNRKLNKEIVQSQWEDIFKKNTFSTNYCIILYLQEKCCINGKK